MESSIEGFFFSLFSSLQIGGRFVDVRSDCYVCIGVFLVRRAGFLLGRGCVLVYTVGEV